MHAGFYVTAVRSPRKVAWLAGPFPSKEKAEEHVHPARAAATAIDLSMCFDAFGVTKLESPRPLRPGVLNGRLGL